MADQPAPAAPPPERLDRPSARRRALACLALLLALLPAAAPAPARAQAATAQPAAEATPSPGGDRPTLQLGLDGPRPRESSALVPALEVGAFFLAFNAWGRFVLREEYAQVTFASIRENLRPSRWWWDEDPMAVNQIGHPLQGSLNYLAARSTGHGPGVSFAVAFAGSLLWEIAGETEPPSYNDQITTPVGGALLGEAMYRAHVLLVRKLPPGFVREALAFVVAPTAGINRALFGGKYQGPEFDEPLRFHLRLTAGGGAAWSRDGAAHTRAVGIASATLRQGIPGDPDLVLRRPFDQFVAHADLAVADGLVSNVLVRGLLAGRSAGGDGAVRGVWGLYGIYDYITPQVVRASAVTLALGASGQWDVGPSLVVQFTAAAGPILFGAAGVTTAPVGFRDQHIGPGVQGLGELSILAGERVRLDLSTREYLIGRAVDTSGFEDITYGTAQLTVRLAGPHGVALGVTGARRTARYDDQGDTRQRFGGATLLYAYEGGDGPAARRRLAD